MTPKPDETAAIAPDPGTPEYEEIYQSAMKALEAADEKLAGDETGIKPAAGDKTPEQIAAEKAAASPVPDEVKKQLDSLQQQLDESNARQVETRNWATRVGQQLRDYQTQVKAGDKPVLLDDLEGLQEAVDHVITERVGADDGLDFPGDEPAVQEYTAEQWLGIVHTAMPDMDELMKDDGLMKQVEDAKGKMGEDWQNPLLAIKAMSDLRSNHIFQQRVGEAVALAIKEHGKTQARSDAMVLEGAGAGGGADMGPDTATRPPVEGDPKVNDAKHFTSMSDEDFERERVRVLNS